MERKRTERSGAPFVLALIDISDLLRIRISPGDSYTEDNAGVGGEGTGDGYPGW
jgi:hypothetical protein